MLRFALIISIVLSYTTGLAQDLAVRHDEVQIHSQISVYNYTYRVQLNPNYQIQIAQNGWAIGPLILIGSNTGSGQPRAKLTGVRMAYNYFPVVSIPKISFYLGTEILAQRIADHWQANIYDPEVNNYRNIHYENLETLVESYTGYGIRLNLKKHWFVYQGIGAGFYYSNLEGKLRLEPAAHLDNIDYRGYDNFGFSWSLKLGLGYRL